MANLGPFQKLALLEELDAIAKQGARLGVKLMMQTRPKLLKKSRLDKSKPCPYNAVERTKSQLVILNSIYENAVNRGLQKQDGEEAVPFKAESLWRGAGKHLTSIVVQHTETKELYLVYRPHQKPSEETIEIIDQWRVVDTGKLLGMAELEELAQFLPQSGIAEQGGLERKVIWRTIKLENVISIQIGEKLLTL